MTGIELFAAGALVSYESYDGAKLEYGLAMRPNRTGDFLFVRFRGGPMAVDPQRLTLVVPPVREEVLNAQETEARSRARSQASWQRMDATTYDTDRDLP